MKIAANALVRSNTQAKYFSATTDSYAGNSGSPVFDQATGLVEGIHVRGEADTITSGGCQISKVCAETGCRAEDATRTTALPLF
jgi:V8-like Glu-specific endopeptidase